VAVYVTTVVPRANEDPEGVSVEMVAQPFTVGAGQVTTLEHSRAVKETLMSEGQPVITGAVLSVTFTLNVQVEVFPASSVAV
jgi:hypothetical protein